MGGVLTIDWIRCTKPLTGEPFSESEKVARAFGLPVAFRESGRYGYTCGWVIGQGGALFFGGDSQGGTMMLDLPASFLSSSEAQIGTPDVLLLSLLSEGWRLTRLDLALDDRDGLSSFELVVDHLTGGHVRTRSQNWSIVQDRTFAAAGFDAGRDGWTVYVGSRSSMTFCRIYNKAAEQGVSGHWIRFEVELKSDKAASVGSALLGLDDYEGIAAFLVGVVRGVIDFTDTDDDDSNVSRRSPASWWLALTNLADRIAVTVSGKLRTMASIVSWLSNCARSLALASHYLGRLGGWRSLFAEGERRYKPEDVLILQRFYSEGLLA